VQQAMQKNSASSDGFVASGIHSRLGFPLAMTFFESDTDLLNATVVASSKIYNICARLENIINGAILATDANRWIVFE
jgi:hypothetical protein